MFDVVEKRITKASVDQVWKAWCSINQWDEGGKEFQTGQTGEAIDQKGKKTRFLISDIQEKESFTMVWKAFFVRLVLYHKVQAKDQGAEIFYRASVRGFFGLPVRLFLGGKIRMNMRAALKGFVETIEQQ